MGGAKGDLKGKGRGKSDQIPKPVCDGGGMAILLNFNDAEAASYRSMLHSKPLGWGEWMKVTEEAITTCGKRQMKEIYTTIHDKMNMGPEKLKEKLDEYPRSIAVMGKRAPWELKEREEIALALLLSERTDNQLAERRAAQAEERAELTALRDERARAERNDEVRRLRAQNARAEAEEIEKEYQARERRKRLFEENDVKLGIDGPPPAQRQRTEGPGEAAPIEPTERQNDKTRPIDDFNSTEVAPDGYQRYVCSKIDCDNKWAGMKDTRPVVCGNCGSDWQTF